ncbi:SMI1/KNR4 family protein [Flavobacterium sp. KACC 22763]|uniref:SMI1/KNR4 family protein n=1 Tax=Flavobacterium sp. KACC 22763 TaxID=3025668 RepID=UPI002366CA20|nr:SMI1/KNR4 family protein [Flavobacterium sp. KACC 22763]WDF66511.1 SMI1/KNR4 family protein [Flavobacterium sp. KACC 22763]
MEYLSFLKQYASEIGNSSGVKSQIIDEIEKKFQLKLPLAYKEYLVNFGANTGNLLSSYYMTYPSLKENKLDVLEMIHFDDRKSEKEKPFIKNSYFFFGQWQGYNFYFFDCELGNDNPEVYILSDGLEISKFKDTFSDFIKDEGIKQLGI